MSEPLTTEQTVSELLAALHAALTWEHNRPSVEILAVRNDRETARIADFYMQVPKWVHQARAAIARAEGKA